MAGEDNDPNASSLDTFSKSSPPAWAPNIVRFPLRRYIQLLKLWWMQTDLSTERIGAAIAGRLKGAALQFAMQLTWSRLDRATLTQVVHVAPKLFALPAEDAVFDPVTGVQISPSELSGAQYLVSKLQSEFSPSAQDLQWQSMISFFDMYRGSQTYEEYQAMHDLAWQDVVSQSNLQMNEVGRTFFLLRGAQLTERQLFDLRLRVDGDLARTQEIRTLLARMFTDTSKIRNSTVPSMTGQYYQETSTDNETWWTDDEVWYEADWDEDTWYDTEPLPEEA